MIIFSRYHLQTYVKNEICLRVETTRGLWLLSVIELLKSDERASNVMAGF